MRKLHKLALLAVLLSLVLALAACEGYSQTGARSSSQRGVNGGEERVSASKANGTSEQDLEDLPNPGGMLEADVTLSVGQGSFKIELLGTDGEATLTLEARGGEQVSGSGSMAVDSFGEASYRVTAVEAEDVEYTIAFVYR
ncbi:MAG: hypothetical protein M8467_09270 [Anaerolineae bacterium]|nr:hypothetical protein [Anaerolineae bacterium]